MRRVVRPNRSATTVNYLTAHVCMIVQNDDKIQELSLFGARSEVTLNYLLTFKVREGFKLRRTQTTDDRLQ